MTFDFLSKILLSGATVCLLSQCRDSRTSGAAEDDPLAVVGGRAITAADLQAEAEWRLANNQMVPEPGDLLEEMVDRAALVERARQLGLDEETDTRRRIESVLIARLREQHLDPALCSLDVSEEELRAAYQQREQDFIRQGMDRFSILFQEAHSKSSEQRRAEARERLQSALARADAQAAPRGRGPAASGFGQVAIDHSDDQASRYRGGDIGWIATDAAQTRFPQALLDLGRDLETGARSGIVESEDGFYVIMKTDTRPGGVRPFEEVSAGLERKLLTEKRRQLEQGFLSESLDHAEVEIHRDAAIEIDLPDKLAKTRPADQPPGFPGTSSPTTSAR